MFTEAVAQDYTLNDRVVIISNPNVENQLIFQTIPLSQLQLSHPIIKITQIKMSILLKEFREANGPA